MESLIYHLNFLGNEDKLWLIKKKQMSNMSKESCVYNKGHTRSHEIHLHK